MSEADGTPPPRRDRLVRSTRLGRRSLTARLASGVVALVVVLVVAVGSVTYFALRSFLDSRLDQQTTSAAAQNGPYFEHCIVTAVRTPSGYRCNTGPLTQQEWVAAIPPQGHAVLTFSGPYVNELQHLTTIQIRALSADPSRLLTVYADGERLRVAAQRTDLGYLVVTGLSTAEVDRTLGRLVVLESVIGGAAIVVAVVATSWGVRRSLRHLYQVTDTAREVAAELSPEGRGLDRRVPVTEEGTEVAQLAESMNTLLGAVETQFAARLESEQRMRQFLADASHELRTPLTSIRGYAELARMQRAAGDREEDNLSRIESEGTRMSRLVEDLLLLARGDADGAERPAEPELIEVAELVDDAVSGARASFPGRPIFVEVYECPQVVGDRDQLLRVVRNLVTNAAVHTAEDRPIHVRSHRVPSGVLVQVIDGGPGLTPEDAAHVFERFWRADKARSRARGGTGLGLPIVASIVRAHGGTVRFDSTVEGGSTVTVWLPGVQRS